LISRAKAGIEIVRAEHEIGQIPDLRGPVSRAVEKPPTSYTPELVALLRNEYEMGKSTREIGRNYDLDRTTVVKHLRESGVKMRRQGLTPEQAASAREMYQSGMTLAEIGEGFEVAQGTIGRCLRSQGISLRPPLNKAIPLV
jgi:DNA invertase Pin-like site-specific DNA recombinase